MRKFDQKGSVDLEGKLRGKRFIRKYSRRFRDEKVDVEGNLSIPWDYIEAFEAAAKSSIPYPFEGVKLIRVAAERDVKPQSPKPEREIEPTGVGVTNVVRAFLYAHDLPREEVEEQLLSDLNTIYEGDCRFERILCQLDEGTDDWEIYLEEKSKGDIRLSQSGSSLKSIFIILTMLRFHSKIEKIDWSKVIFAVEEPENNLHPALMRRLLDFLAAQRAEKGFTLIITTHSPIAIDWSERREDSQIIHVQHDGFAATTSRATAYRENRKILEDLDIRASDLLQANGLIWVEGPSDRIYLDRWIELASGGTLREGTHFTVMFYGGRLLSHLDVLPPDESDKLISLLSINRNTAVLIDSDRHLGSKESKGKPRMKLNATKRRIRKEVESNGSLVWITEGREIENYTKAEVLGRVLGGEPPKVGRYAQVAEHPSLKSFNKNKILLADAVVGVLEVEDLKDHMDLWQRLEELCGHIQRWNGIEPVET